MCQTRTSTVGRGACVTELKGIFKEENCLTSECINV